MLYLDAEGAGHPALSSRWLPLSAHRGHLISAADIRQRLAAHNPGNKGSTVDRIFALTQPRSMGFSFNPVNFYFCFSGDQLVALLADVNNTPWDERHCYVLDAQAARKAEGRYDFRFAKRLHVSPFLPMDGHYRLRLRFSPGRLRIAMRFANSAGPMFAHLSLRTRPLTRAEAIWGAVRWPAQNALTLARIYWQAALLFAKRTPFHPHPKADEPLPSARVPAAPAEQQHPPASGAALRRRSLKPHAANATGKEPAVKESAAEEPAVKEPAAEEPADSIPARHGPADHRPGRKVPA